MFRVMWLFFKTRWEEDYNYWFDIILSITIVYGVLILLTNTMATWTDSLFMYVMTYLLSALLTYLVVGTGFLLAMGFVLMYEDKKLTLFSRKKS